MANWFVNMGQMEKPNAILIMATRSTIPICLPHITMTGHGMAISHIEGLLTV